MTQLLINITFTVKNRMRKIIFSVALALWGALAFCQSTGLTPVDDLNTNTSDPNHLSSGAGCIDSVALQPDSSGDKTVQYTSGFPTISFYTSPLIHSTQWTGGGLPVEGRSLLNFNLSEIPADVNILNATLSLYADTNNTDDGNLGQPMYGNDNASYLRMVTSAWVDSMTNWNTQPTTTLTGEVLLPQSTSTTQDYPNIDITGFVQYWYNNPNLNFGMELVMRDSVYYNSLIFCSSRYPDSTKRPKLFIRWNLCQTGIRPVDGDFGGYIFPNPASDVLNIRMPETGSFDVAIDDISGNRIIEVKNMKQLNIGRLAAGCYLVTLAQNGNRKTMRFIKE
jgi:hypothetical protein